MAENVTLGDTGVAHVDEMRTRVDPLLCTPREDTASLGKAALNQPVLESDAETNTKRAIIWITAEEARGIFPEGSLRIGVILNDSQGDVKIHRIVVQRKGPEIVTAPGD